jgi:hypothetical protein
MHSFYQSDSWIRIQKEVFKKPSFTVEFDGKQYFWFAKFWERFGVKSSWYMVHGIPLQTIHTYSHSLMESFARLKRDHLSKRWDIFFQCWSCSVIDAVPTNLAKSEDYCASMRKKHRYLAHDFRQWYRLTPSWREHMPEATIIISITWKNWYRSTYSQSCKRFLNKAKKQWLTFSKAKKTDRDAFYDVWYAMAYEKGFSIITRDMFFGMMDYLNATKEWYLFLAKHKWAIVSGSVILTIWDELVYLYWATNRVFGDIWAHYWLTDKILSWWEDSSYTCLDLLWISAPRALQDHPLRGVTRFKQAFGWTTYSYVGNFDLIGNQMLYKTFKLIKSIG